MSAPAIAMGLAVLAIAALAGCESSQDRSAELAKGAKNAIKSEKGVEIHGQSKVVKVLGATALTDQNGSAVVVTLVNQGSTTITDAPIAIKVLNAKGKQLYTNTTPGIEKALHTVPSLPAGQPIDWVNDQVFASSPPRSVKVQVGNTQSTASVDPSSLKVSPPEIVNDPVSGVEATGTIASESGGEVDDVLLMAVARRGGKVVAAGRGGVKKVKPAGEKPVHFHIFFIGDPKGASVSVEAYPNELG